MLEILGLKYPITSIFLFQKKPLKSLLLEKKVLENSDLVLATTKIDQKRFEKKGAKKVIEITNAFKEIWPKAEKKPNQTFTLLYAGGLESDRNPSILWEVLKDLSLEKIDFRIEFCGNISNEVILELKDKNLFTKCQFFGYLSLEKTQEKMSGADLLILTNFFDIAGEGIIPGKLFEYLASGKPIVSVGYPNTEVEEILAKVGLGKHFYQQKKELKTYLLQRIQNPNLDLKVNESELLKYRRKEISWALKHELIQLLQPKD
ncbi:MAG: hypothetical protein C4K58_06210 [Flavobacteriaceae bacterium]|nr:MAG: hypothetical protein C4K58_06210 [Flavobacteriaceae bacterium]